MYVACMLLLVLMTYGMHSRPYHTGDVFSGWGQGCMFWEPVCEWVRESLLGMRL